MNSDLWLQRWLTLVKERSLGLPILELGCGSGEDTATLLTAGHAVIAIDSSVSAIEKAKLRAPQAEYHCQDIRAPFPSQANNLGVVVASLSLHYFSWSETLTLVERIGTTLRQGGVLISRFNSTNDRNYGAIGHPQIEENYFTVGGQPKRFFDIASLQSLFSAGWWNTLATAEFVIQKYEHPKTVWEVIVARDA